MPTQTVPYEFLPDIRRRAEELRMQNVRQAVKGSIAAHSITADRMATGVLQVGDGGAVTITPEAITAPMMATNVLHVGTDGAVTIEDGAITASKLDVSELSAITANMGTLTAGTINGGTIISGSGSPQAIFSPDGIVLTNAQTAETVNHAPSHVDFFSDSGADAEQKGTLACFIGPAIRNYAPHLTLRALCPDEFKGRASLSCWIGTSEITTASMFPTGTFSVFDHDATLSTSVTYTNSPGEQHGSWPNGDLYAVQFHSTSDRKLKQKIRKLDGNLDAVKGLKPVSFEWKRTGKPAVGFVAQDVETVLPDAVRDDAPTGFDPQTGEPTGYAKAVNLLHLLTSMVGAVQELAARVEALERR